MRQTNNTNSLQTQSLGRPGGRGSLPTQFCGVPTQISGRARRGFSPDTFCGSPDTKSLSRLGARFPTHFCGAPDTNVVDFPTQFPGRPDTNLWTSQRGGFLPTQIVDFPTQISGRARRGFSPDTFLWSGSAKGIQGWIGPLGGRCRSPLVGGLPVSGSGVSGGSGWVGRAAGGLGWFEGCYG